MTTVCSSKYDLLTDVRQTHTRNHRWKIVNTHTLIERVFSLYSESIAQHKQLRNIDTIDNLSGQTVVDKKATIMT